MHNNAILWLLFFIWSYGYAKMSNKKLYIFEKSKKNYTLECNVDESEEV